MYARRRFAVFTNLMEYVGLEPGRLHFSWISSAEAEKFQRTATTFIDNVRALGPVKHMIKDIRRVA
jgi:F420-non-reducing hydrogenase iron-sulfur subunit